MERQITALSWALLIVLGVIWGSTFLVITTALDSGVPSGWVAAARVVFAAILLAAVWGTQGFRLTATPIGAKLWLSLLLIGLLSTTIPFSLLAWGQQNVTTSFTGIALASSLFLILPLAHVMIPGERMTLRGVIGLSIGLVGVMLLIGGDAFRSTGAENELLSRLAILATAACYAVSSVLMRRLPPMDTTGLAALLMIIGAVAILPLSWVTDGAPSMPSPKVLGALAILGLLHTAAAGFIRVYLIRTSGPTFMGLVNYIVPLVALLIGALVLKEPLPSSLMAALVLILGGMAISEWTSLKRLAARLTN